MIKTIALSLSWTPKTIGGLYLDGIDFQGIEYWYDHIKGEVDRLGVNNE